jgi:uncharacterized protein YdaU (DUF1376 family)
MPQLKPKFDINAFLSSQDVQLMTVEEIGAYCLLLFNLPSQRNPGYILNDESLLMRLARMTKKQWIKHKEIILKKFELTEHGWTNKRMLKEINDYRSFIDRQTKNGKLRKKQRKQEAKPKPSLSQASAKPPDNEPEIVLPFNTENFKFWWGKWLQYRADIKKPYKSKLSEQAALQKLSAYTEDVAIKMIKESISNTWQGLFELKENAAKTNPYQNRHKPITTEEILESVKRGNPGSFQ